MIAQIEVQQETARRLSELAASRGLSVEAYLKTLLDSEVTKSESSSQLTPREKANSFIEWANSHHLSAPPLSDEAMSRENIYTREDEQF
jgi:hypothetical protein